MSEMQQRQDLNMLMGLEQGDYAKYLNQLNQYNVNRNFDYNRYADELAQRNYEQSRLDNLIQQNISNATNQDNTQYARAQNDKAYARELAMQQIAAGQVPDDALLAAAGISPSYAQSLAAYYREQAGKADAAAADDRSPAFKNVESTAKNYDDIEEAEAYLNRMVDGRYITPDEAAYIYQVVLGQEADKPGFNLWGLLGSLLGK